jgi:hypothetical protein
MFILVNKPYSYMVEELNFCQHKWIYKTVSAKEVFLYVVAKKIHSHCDELSVITKTDTSIKVQPYPIWAKENL